MITEQQANEVIKSIEDPELNIDIHTLGLIYTLKINDESTVAITMTFTSPLCPFGPQIVDELKQKLTAAGATKVTVEIVFDPPWEPSETVKEMLGITSLE